MDWESLLRTKGALWQHDGHPARPYALLTSGLISDGYVNTTHIVAEPRLLKAAAVELADKLRLATPRSYLRDAVVVGQMQGSVTLGSRIAEELDIAFIYTEKLGEGSGNAMQLAPRFRGLVKPTSHVLFVEDVTTTGSTTLASRKAMAESGFFRVLPFLLTFAKSSELSRIEDMRIISCLSVSHRTWKNGENPYTRDGKELIPPVRPKSADGRRLHEQLPD